MGEITFGFKPSLSLPELADYLKRQLEHFFPDRRTPDSNEISKHMDPALERLQLCFRAIRRKYFVEGGQVCFNHLQSEQYAMWLYLLANTVYRAGGDEVLATKIYYLNKALHGIDVYFEVALPRIFLFRHCVGTVLGRATYADYFSVGQNCTVGNNHGVYPIFNEGVAMYNGSMIVGRCTVGPNVHISARTFVRDRDLPENTTVFGEANTLIFKTTKQSVKNRFFNMI